MCMEILMAYNANGNSDTEILTFDGDCFTDAVTYEESLVIPPDYNWEEEELRGEATYVEKFVSGSAHT
ncbi:hypothetical protein ACSBR2_002444 [Camellia fascicularis]